MTVFDPGHRLKKDRCMLLPKAQVHSQPQSRMSSTPARRLAMAMAMANFSRHKHEVKWQRGNTSDISLSALIATCNLSEANPRVQVNPMALNIVYVGYCNRNFCWAQSCSHRTIPVHCSVENVLPNGLRDWFGIGGSRVGMSTRGVLNVRITSKRTVDDGGEIF